MHSQEEDEEGVAEERQGKFTPPRYFFRESVIQLNILHFELIRCKRHDLRLISREEMDEGGEEAGQVEEIAERAGGRGGLSEE